jgi:hypothetical protein
MNTNIRLFPITVLYFNKRCEVREKHLVVYARLLSNGNLAYKQKRKIVRKQPT